MVPSKRAQDDDVRAQHAQYVCLVLFGRMPAPLRVYSSHYFVPVCSCTCITVPRAIVFISDLPGDT